MQIEPDKNKLIAGKWYAIGIANLDGDINWGGAPLFRYEGEGCWASEEGEPVETVWDVAFQTEVGINSADAYQLQA